MNAGNPRSRDNRRSVKSQSVPMEGEEIGFLVHRVLGGCEKVTPEPDWALLAPIEVISYSGEVDSGQASLRLPGGIVNFSQPSMVAATLLSKVIRKRLKLEYAADEHDILLEILKTAARCILGQEDRNGLEQRLIAGLPSLLGKSITVFAVGGLDIGPRAETPVLKIGSRVVVGGIDDATERAVSELCDSTIRRGFWFSDDALWTEDLLALRSDPLSFDNEGDAFIHGLSVVAWAIDAVDYVAGVRARQAIEGLLGAFWLISESDRSWPSSPPWIIGTPTRSESPRAPGVEDDDGLLPIEGLQVNSRNHGVQSVSFSAPSPRIDVRKAMGGDYRDLVELVASVETPGIRQSLARRVSAACRLIRLAGQDRILDLSLLYSVIALEALVSDHVAEPGVTNRFVRRVNALLPSRDRQGLLDLLYNLRSEIGHQGFTLATAADSVVATNAAIKLSHDAVMAIVQLIKDQDLQTDDQLLRWLDLQAEAREMRLP